MKFEYFCRFCELLCHVMTHGMRATCRIVIVAVLPGVVRSGDEESRSVGRIIKAMRRHGAPRLGVWVIPPEFYLVTRVVSKTYARST